MKFCSAFLLISLATISSASPIEHPLPQDDYKATAIAFKQVIESAPGPNPEIPRATVKREVVRRAETIPLNPTTLIKLDGKAAGAKTKRVVDKVLPESLQDTVLVDLTDVSKLPTKRDYGTYDEKKQQKSKQWRKQKSLNDNVQNTEDPVMEPAGTSEDVDVVSGSKGFSMTSAMSGGLRRNNRFGNRNWRRDTGGNDARQRHRLNHRRDSGGNDARQRHGLNQKRDSGGNDARKSHGF